MPKAKAASPAKTTKIKSAKRKPKYNPEIDLTGAQEDFCQQYVGKARHNASNAYMLAYPKSLKWQENTLNVRASQLMAIHKISMRVIELQAETAQEVKLTAAKVLKDLEETRRLAIKVDQHSAAIRCSELQGKHLGIFEKDNLQRGKIMVELD